MKNIMIVPLTLLAFIIVVVPPVLAVCPEGNSEVTRITPSGKEKILCLPDKAISGIEIAADHSAGIISTTMCPCWNGPDDIRELFSGYEDYLVCYTNANEIALQAYLHESFSLNAVTSKADPLSSYCYFSSIFYGNSSEEVSINYLSEEEVNACWADIDIIVTEQGLVCLDW